MTCLVAVARHTPGLTSGLSAHRAFLPGSALGAVSRHLEKGDPCVRPGCRQAPQEGLFRNSLTALVLSQGAPSQGPASPTFIPPLPLHRAKVFPQTSTKRFFLVL